MYNAIHKEASFESKCKLQIKKNSLHDAIFALHIIPSCINRINKYFTINTKKKKGSTNSVLGSIVPILQTRCDVPSVSRP